MKPAPTRGSKPGERRGGRQKGTPNKTTKAAKEAIHECFERLGSVDGLHEWAQDNKKEFYTVIWPKIIPLQVGGEEGNPIVTEIVQRIVHS
jgi:hypothetical protein